MLFDCLQKVDIRATLQKMQNDDFLVRCHVSWTGQNWDISTVWKYVAVLASAS